jgi:uncharacterized DUF497 family protein
MRVSVRPSAGLEIDELDESVRQEAIAVIPELKDGPFRLFAKESTAKAERYVPRYATSPAVPTRLCAARPWTAVGHTDEYRVLLVAWTVRTDALGIVTARAVGRRARDAYLRAKGLLT